MFKLCQYIYIYIYIYTYTCHTPPQLQIGASVSLLFPSRPVPSHQCDNDDSFPPPDIAEGRAPSWITGHAPVLKHDVISKLTRRMNAHFGDHPLKLERCRED